MYNSENLDNIKYATHKVVIDFGEEIGPRVSCARLVNYSIEELIGKDIVGIINLPQKKRDENISEVLILGTPDSKHNCVLLSPDKNVPPGNGVY